MKKSIRQIYQQKRADELESWLFEDDRYDEVVGHSHTLTPSYFKAVEQAIESSAVPDRDSVEFLVDQAFYGVNNWYFIGTDDQLYHIHDQSRFDPQSIEIEADIFADQLRLLTRLCAEVVVSGEFRGNTLRCRAQAALLLTHIASQTLRKEGHGYLPIGSELTKDYVAKGSFDASVAAYHFLITEPSRLQSDSEREYRTFLRTMIGSFAQNQLLISRLHDKDQDLLWGMNERVGRQYEPSSQFFPLRLQADYEVLN